LEQLLYIIIVKRKAKNIMISFLDYLNETTKDNNSKIKIVVFQGSPRTKNTCSGGDSKTSFLMKKAIKEITEDVKFTVIDLKVEDTDPQIRPCKGCIGTSNGFHCHYECSCYAKGDGTNDLMHEKDVYKKLEEADGFVVFTPVHWSGPSSQVKALFDRLVCANLTLTQEQAKEIYGKDIKNPKLTIAAEQSGKYRDLLKNHYEGKVGAFFIHGDDGADDYNNRRFPLSMADYKQSHYIDPKQAIMPIVNQCRYSGIFVPESCIEGVVFGYKEKYSQNNIDIKKSNGDKLLEKAQKIITNLVTEIRNHKRIK
jgi:multimeric flavodoxin WrbA